MSYITKLAETQHGLFRPGFAFPNARSAFRAYMQALGLGPGDGVLLPSYIGWSAREGSGVFDPVEELGVRYAFYRMTDRLAIDIDDLRRQIRDRRFRLLVLIHYFGFPDPQYASVCELARECEVPVLEDEAHAMLSDVIGGICGRLGDAAIYSLHKLLPVADGGRLVLNRPEAVEISVQDGIAPQAASILQDYDLYQIAKKRRFNAEYLLDALRSSDLPITPLFDQLPDGVVPQSLPVVIERGSRDDLYFAMNAAGYGVVSLYHTLIRQIASDEFPDSHALSRKIMNLPVHQDTNPEILSSLLECLHEQLCRPAYS